jgi:hypothetical protein
MLYDNQRFWDRHNLIINKTWFNQREFEMSQGISCQPNPPRLSPLHPKFRTDKSTDNQYTQSYTSVCGFDTLDSTIPEYGIYLSVVSILWSLLWLNYLSVYFTPKFPERCCVILHLLWNYFLSSSRWETLHWCIYNVVYVKRYVNLERTKTPLNRRDGRQ